MDRYVTTAIAGLRARLTYLRNWELVNVALVPAQVAVIWYATGDAAVAWRLRALGMLLVSYLLLQGGIYWHLKLQAVRRVSGGLPAWFVPVFSGLKWTNPLLIGAAAAYVMLGRHGAGTADRAWSLAILAFAYIEHVNYYVRQLMHDTAADAAYLKRFRRLRHAPLRRDLASARSR